MSEVVGFFFGVCAVVALVYGVVALAAGMSFALRCETAEGKVLSQQAVGETVSAMRTEVGMSYQPVVRFADRKGRDVDFRSTIGYNPPRHRPGQTVTIQYDPRRPEHAVILGDTNLKGPAGFVFLGLFLGLVAVVSFVVP